MFRLPFLVLFFALTATACTTNPNDNHRIYVTGSIIDRDVDHVKIGVGYEYSPNSDWSMTLGLVGSKLPQFSIQRLIGGKTHLRAGVGYFLADDAEPIQCSRLNARIGAGVNDVANKFSLLYDHSSNGNLCVPNSGFDTLSLGFKIDD